MNKTTQNSSQSEKKSELADELKEAFKAVSPFIEKHTLIVCPECEKVCCIDKHGRYDIDDLIFLRALGVEVKNNQPDREETGPCRYMNEKGCLL
ncbi:MAG: hypothetical protein HY757_08175 [Nitrospirae bacterium]|nr:hypothetical protein [Nitrospirota bacterium]